MTTPSPFGARRSRLLFVNAHYYPDVASTGQHLTDLAEFLADRGYEVNVLTSRTAYVAGRLGAPASEVRNGVRITRLRGSAFGRSSNLGRLVDYALFYIRVLAHLMAGSPDSRVVFLTTPPLLGFLGRVARALRGTRYAIWSMDLHPDAEFAAGMVRQRSVLGRLLDWANSAGYRGADFVVDLGSYMKRRIVAKGVVESATKTVYVWSRAEEVEPTPPAANPLRAESDLRDRFVVMYSGNAGIVHDFDPLLEAMRILMGHPRIYFLFVGGGPQRARIEAFAREHDIRNFDYRSYYPRKALRYSLSIADAHVVTLRQAFGGIAVPGKLYGIMAAGRPALFIGPSASESAEAILDADCGAVVDTASVPEAGRRVAEILSEWARSPSVVSAAGAAGRAAFLARYERVPNCESFERIVRDAWGGGTATHEPDRGNRREPASAGPRGAAPETAPGR